MILSGREIHSRMGKDIIIEPYDRFKLNPNSYNLTLGNRLLVYDKKKLDMREPNPFHELTIPEDGLWLKPGWIYLAETVERTKTKNLVPMVEGRSSIGRLGLFVHVSAGFGDNNFDGKWTLELHCVQPIKIYPGIDICQIYYHEIKGECDEYDGKYNKNNGVQPSRMWTEFQK